MRNQKNKSFYQAIACLLVMILAITSLPATALAITVESPETVTFDGEEYVPQIFEWESEEMIYAVNEIVSLRGENVKHFSLPNGTYRAVAYDSAVHRLDENGKWQDIDNSLTAATEKGKSVLKTSDGRITVPATFTASEPVLSLWEDGVGIAMYFVSGRTASVGANQHVTASASAASVQNAPKRPLGFDTVEEAIAVDNKASVTYEGVLPETDLQYEIRGNDVKENIIIGAPSALYEYTFLLRLSALTATLEEDGSISLREETGRERAVIPAPFMYDAAGNRSYLVSYTLEDGGEGLYALTVSADADWINDEERAFPVTVDPYIDWSEDNAYAADTYITSTDPDENFGLEEDVKISANDIALLQVELPYIPDGSMVNSANLVIQYYGTSSQGASSGSTSVSIYQMLESWYELDVTWNEVAEWDDFGMEAEPVSTVTLSTEVGTTSANRATANIPIKSVAKDWYGYSENYGVAIKYNFGDMDTLYFTAFEGGEGYAYISVEYVYYIPDGIYALQNAGWMTASSTSVSRQSLATPPHENFYRSGLFKITRVTPDGVAAARYVIRSMWDNNLGLSVSGTTPVVKELPSRDSEVSSSDTFYIDWHISGFHIRAYNGNVVLAAPSISSGEVITLPGDTNASLSTWDLYAYTDASHRAYIQIYIPYSWDSKGAIVGTTYSVPYYVHWSTYVGADTFRLRVMPQSEEIASYTWEEDTKTFTVTPLSPGTMELRAEILYGDSATEEVAFRQSFSKKVIPKEGTYYFQNAGTGRYMDVEGPSTASGAAIHEWDLHTATQEKWIVEHVAGSGGYVRIKSAYSNLYLGISSTNSSYVGQYSTLNNYTLWRFERTPSGNLQLICAATDTADLVLSVPTTASPSNNGANLTQYDKDNTFTLDEWKMYPFVAKLRLDIYADGGYRQRHNSESGERNYSDRINIMMKRVQQRYLEEFGILIAYSEINHFVSLADACPSKGSAIDDLCVCSNTGCRENHHKNYFNILDDIGADKEEKLPHEHQVLEIYFIGHETCTMRGNEHSDVTAGGWTIREKGFAVVTSSQAPLGFETDALMHEIGHFYQVLHHNGGDNYTTAQRKESNPNYDHMCIYGDYFDIVKDAEGEDAAVEVRSHIYETLPLCGGCKDLISYHATDYDHS